jgi:hypothetical protein
VNAASSNSILEKGVRGVTRNQAARQVVFRNLARERKDLRIKGNLEYAYGTASCDLSDFPRNWKEQGQGIGGVAANGR